MPFNGLAAGTGSCAAAPDTTCKLATSAILAVDANNRFMVVTRHLRCTLIIRLRVSVKRGRLHEDAGDPINKEEFYGSAYARYRLPQPPGTRQGHSCDVVHHRPQGGAIP